MDVIHRSHRYIAVWPAQPGRRGAPYRWYDPAGAVMGAPSGAPPPLPAPWLEFLAGRTVPAGRRTASPTPAGRPVHLARAHAWTRARMLAQVNPLLERLAAHGRSGRTRSTT
ncbi:MAG: hypothetical protein IPG94_26835 [Kineosporiaceae bacterium]|nr:hypothetical protein [Kineosporiaceae bacterium]